MASLGISFKIEATWDEEKWAEIHDRIFDYLDRALARKMHAQDREDLALGYLDLGGES